VAKMTEGSGMRTRNPANSYAHQGRLFFTWTAKQEYVALTLEGEPNGITLSWSGQEKKIDGKRKPTGGEKGHETKT